jgi:hypothetical protein
VLQLVLQLDIIKKKLKKKIYGNPISFLSLNKHSQQPANNNQPAPANSSQHQPRRAQTTTRQCSARDVMVLAVARIHPIPRN